MVNDSDSNGNSLLIDVHLYVYLNISHITRLVVREKDFRSDPFVKEKKKNSRVNEKHN